MATSLEAISPVDGRYSKTTAAFIPYFSEYALFRYRLIIEIEYLIELSHPGFPCEGLFTVTDVEKLRDLYKSFSTADALKIKEIEPSWKTHGKKN